MIASLPMYTNAVTEAACDRFWAAWSERLRESGLDAPSHLFKSVDGEAIWTDPCLLVSQTCGYPYMSRLRDNVRLVATPHYDVEGCDGPNYSSWIVVHADNTAETLADLRGKRAAINMPGSQSGYNSFRAAIAPIADGKAFFAQVHQTGSHAGSMQAVADGIADCAAIDVVSWALTLAAEPSLAQRLRRLCATPQLPGLPFITAGHRSDRDTEKIQTALFDTLADPDAADDCATLRISGASVIPDNAYDACLEMERRAIAQAYPHLR